MKNLIIIISVLFALSSCHTSKHGQVYKTGSTCRNPHKRHEVHNFTRIR